MLRDYLSTLKKERPNPPKEKSNRQNDSFNLIREKKKEIESPSSEFEKTDEKPGKISEEKIESPMSEESIKEAFKKFDNSKDTTDQRSQASIKPFLTDKSEPVDARKNKPTPQEIQSMINIFNHVLVIRFHQINNTIDDHPKGKRVFFEFRLCRSLWSYDHLLKSHEKE